MQYDVRLRELARSDRKAATNSTTISKLVAASGYGSDQIVIDPSVVRGLEYYTGPVYEVELTLETKDEKGRPVRFGSVGGGGRYDGLVSRFRGEPVPATGFSIGVSRLQAALTMLGKLDTRPDFGPVVVTVFDRDRVADYQKMVAQLRNANIRAELYLGNPKNMGNQLKYADRRNSPCVDHPGLGRKGARRNPDQGPDRGREGGRRDRLQPGMARDAPGAVFVRRRRDRRKGARSAGAP